MNTKVLYSTYFMRFILLLFIVPAFQACIDNKYDLDKDLSLEISVGENTWPFLWEAPVTFIWTVL